MDRRPDPASGSRHPPVVDHRDPTSGLARVARHRDPTSELSAVVGHRCNVHDLAVGMDGRCVRCRKADERLAAATRSHFPGWTLIIAVLVTLGSLGWLFFGPRPAREEARRQEQSSGAAAVKPDSRIQWEQLGSGTPAGPAPAPSRSPTGSPPPATTSPEPAASNAKLAAEYIDRVREAASRVQIQMYYTTWCPVCIRGRKWMADNQIPFTGHDVERVEGARAVMKQLNPRNSIPTFKVGRQVLEGYSATALCQAILNEASNR